MSVGTVIKDLKVGKDNACKRGRDGMEEAKPIQEGEHKQRRMLETCIDQKHFPIHHSLAWAGIIMGTLRCICQNHQVLFAMA